MTAQLGCEAPTGSVDRGRVPLLHEHVLIVANRSARTSTRHRLLGHLSGSSRASYRWRRQHSELFGRGRTGRLRLAFRLNDDCDDAARVAGLSPRGYVQPC